MKIFDYEVKWLLSEQDKWSAGLYKRQEYLKD